MMNSRWQTNDNAACTKQACNVQDCTTTEVLTRAVDVVQCRQQKKHTHVHVHVHTVHTVHGIR